MDRLLLILLGDTDAEGSTEASTDSSFFVNKDIFCVSCSPNSVLCVIVLILDSASVSSVRWVGCSCF